LKGLGFVSQEGCLEGDGEEEEPMTATTSSRKLPGSFRDGYFDDGEDTDESSWLHYSSSSSREFVNGWGESESVWKSFESSCSSFLTRVDRDWTEGEWVRDGWDWGIYWTPLGDSTDRHGYQLDQDRRC
jgi:hypothetical protein